MPIVPRKTCRACGSPALTPVIDLGDQFLQGSFVKPGETAPVQQKFPTALVRCDPARDPSACGLLQLAQTLPPELLYEVYWYRSGTNQTMRDHLGHIAATAAQWVPESGGRVLDIGCNDGTMLRAYPRHWARYGIDPSDIAQEIKDGIQVVQGCFPSPALDNATGGIPFDVITSIAMFYDLESPIDFARAIKRHLAPRGVWIFEMSYMPEMLRLGSYDTICHEHLEYYSLAVIDFILRQSNLCLFDATLNDINGGSICCYATHMDNISWRNSGGDLRLHQLRNRESELSLDTDAPYLHFQQRAEDNRRNLRSLLLRLKSEGKKIHIYGASTKGNTILQFCGLDYSIIDFAADRNPDKHGARTLGTDIPILSEAESRALSPDYYLVLPWHFRNEFLVREREMLAAGVQMIFPLPEIEIVGGSRMPGAIASAVRA